MVALMAFLPWWYWPLSWLKIKRADLMTIYCARYEGPRTVFVKFARSEQMHNALASGNQPVGNVRAMAVARVRLGARDAYPLHPGSLDQALRRGYEDAGRIPALASASFRELRMAT